MNVIARTIHAIVYSANEKSIIIPEIINSNHKINIILLPNIVNINTPNFIFICIGLMISYTNNYVNPKNNKSREYYPDSLNVI